MSGLLIKFSIIELYLLFNIYVIEDIFEIEVNIGLYEFNVLYYYYINLLNYLIIQFFTNAYILFNKL